MFGLINKYLNLLRSFGIKIVLLQLFRAIFHKNNKIGIILDKKKHENVKKYLMNHYGYVIEKYKNLDGSECETYPIQLDSNIWVFWWQGLDAAPEIVRIAVTSIIQNKGERHSVIIIDKGNYQNYVSMPPIILRKFKAGKMSITHFSDILRMALLAQYGGFWVDATMLLTDSLDHLSAYDKSFFTIHHGLYSDWHVCKGLWSGFCMASGKENPMFAFFKEMFYEYWKNENCLICYFLIDCIMSLGYENIDYIKRQIDMVPLNNSKVFILQNELNLAFSSQKWDSSLKDCTLHKLNYKMMLRKDINGSPTLYGYLSNQITGQLSGLID